MANLRIRGRSPHIQAALRLSTGVGLAQLVLIVTAPIVSRLYDPSEYGTMAVYVAIVTVVSTVATGRFDAAVSLPSETEAGEREALALVRLALSLTAATAVLSLVFVAGALLLGVGPIASDLAGWAWAVPFGILTLGASQTLMAYAARQREFKRIAKIPLAQRVSSATVQIGLGMLGAGRSGLMLAAVVSPLVGLGALARLHRRFAKEYGAGIARKDTATGNRVLVSRYSDFPLQNLPFALLNGLSWNFQAVVLAWFFAPSEVGQYALAATVVGMPSVLIVSAISQVYSRETAALVEQPAATLKHTKRMLFTLVWVSLLIFPMILIFSPVLFSIIFGEQWVEAGSIAAALTPVVWARFLGTTVSGVMVTYRRQSLLLAWQVTVVILGLGAFCLGGAVGLSVTQVTWLASALLAPLYLALVPMALGTLRRAVRDRESSNVNMAVGPPERSDGA